MKDKLKLRDPFFMENVCHDQPYSSWVLMAPYCDFKCYGCQNKEVVRGKVDSFSIYYLKNEFKDNPFVDGITVAGLEICLSGSDFIKDLYYFIKLANISRVTIYSRFELDDERLSSFLEKIKDLECVTELYCKTGKYIDELDSKISNFYYKGNPWSICLGSKNQDFNIIKGNELIKLTVNDDCLK